MASGVDIEDPTALRAYLTTLGHLPPQAALTCQTLAGGVSSRVVLVQFTGGNWVLKQSLPKLRVALDWYSDPIRIHREALGLRWLERLLPPGSVPSLVFEDHAQHVLAMQAVPEPHDNWKSLLLAGRLSQDHVTEFARLLGQLHVAAWQRRDELAPLFDDRQFFESLRIEPYFGCAAELVPEAAPFLQALMAATRAERWTLVHGDYSPKNVLIHEQRLVLLDHEVIHWGDPAFDVGFALTHLLSKAHHLRDYRPQFQAAAHTFWRAYAAEIGTMPWSEELEPRAVRQVLACLLARVAGRSPLEYLTPDERIRQRDVVVRLTHAEWGRALVQEQHQDHVSPMASLIDRLGQEWP